MIAHVMQRNALASFCITYLPHVSPTSERSGSKISKRSGFLDAQHVGTICNKSAVIAAVMLQRYIPSVFVCDWIMIQALFSGNSRIPASEAGRVWSGCR